MPQTKEGKGNLRVIHRDQLQVIRAGGNPRVPDCYQKTPKRIPVSEQGQILTVAVDSRGISLPFWPDNTRKEMEIY